MIIERDVETGDRRHPKHKRESCRLNAEIVRPNMPLSDYEIKRTAGDGFMLVYSNEDEFGNDYSTEITISKQEIEEIVKAIGLLP